MFRLVKRISRAFGQDASKRSMASTAEVVFEERPSGLAVITLNREKALNALNLKMVRTIYPQLRRYDKEPAVSHVVIRAVGTKAFCAGGDVKAVVQSCTVDEDGLVSIGEVGRQFFREEYMLNYLIGTMTKPYVAVIDGITMGGGVGLSVHGRFRVATERTVFAMPETAIGLFPDVGGSHFLPRLAGRTGLYLALTGRRLKGMDVKASGVATHFVHSAHLDDVLAALDGCTGSDVGPCLDEFENKSKDSVPASRFPDDLPKINRYFAYDSVVEIFQRLADGASDGDGWAESTLETVKKMSPISMCISLEQLKRGASMDFADVFQMEYRLSQRCLLDNDFREGVRAMLLDRDNSPTWKPARLSDVTKEHIDWYFSPFSSFPETHSHEELKMDVAKL